jgi:hypothetical protein
MMLGRKRSSSTIRDRGVSELRRGKASRVSAMRRNRLKGMKIAMQERLGIMRAIFDGSDENIFKRNSQATVLNS